jgi:hypothetical protein
LSSFLDFRLILSITAQSIFAVEPSVWARWKDILLDIITKIKNNNNSNNFFFLGSLKTELPKKHIFNIFQIWSIGRRLSLASSLKTASGQNLENIDF